MTIGQTPVSELAKQGKQDCDGKCYVINGINFWHHNESVFNFMYLTKTNQLPSEWRQLGLSFDISYREWLDLLAKMEYRITVEKAPTLEKWQGKDSFSATLIGDSTRELPTRIELDFSYSQKTTEDAKGTLYSIRVRAKR